MPAPEYLKALGRLLREGILRDAFAANPMDIIQAMQLSTEDSEALVRLDPKELEYQAQVLLRKRFEAAKEFLPETCRRLGSDAWTEFRNYSRIHWPTEKMDGAEDAVAFLRVSEPARNQCPEEFNRLLFARSRKRFGMAVAGKWDPRRTRAPILQCFVRRNGEKICEWRFSLRF